MRNDIVLPKGFEMTIVPQPWISVKDRLPEEDEDVIVFTDEQGERGIHVASVDEDGVWCPSHGDGWMFPTVTHWMPLPAPPTDGK
jgi:hypothetical protein